MQARFKRFTALILSVLMVLACMPMSAVAEDAVIPAEDISVEVIPEDAEAVPEQETATVMDNPRGCRSSARTGNCDRHGYGDI